jgi:hypothetical protein
VGAVTGGIRPKFLDPLKLEEVGVNLEGEPVWDLLGVLRYDSAVLRCRLEVPVGFRTDLSSVPRRFLLYRLLGGRARKAGVIHDYVYREHLLGMFPSLSDAERRAIADAVYPEAVSVSEDVPRWLRWLAWLGLRWGGRTAWDQAAAPELRA